MESRLDQAYHLLDTASRGEVTRKRRNYLLKTLYSLVNLSFAYWYTVIPRLDAK